MLVDLKRILAPRRRRKPPRPDGPRTIVPPREPAPAADRFDAARDRLRREIPPRDDD